ncbi:hypothetical protein P4C99_10095 [Pontiellaceae bacterium B1224]|nr:hypothetical protein [Pontiellaceae bacterium B1224]
MKIRLCLFAGWTLRIYFDKKYPMKLSILSIIFFLLLSTAAKPGESYILTGRETSIFGIFQADLKAYPELYEGEDVNAYYQSFKTLNNLGERKLKPGEELIFPDTALSKKIKEAEAAEAARAAAEAEAAVAAAEAAEAQTQGAAAPAAAPSTAPYGEVSLFGTDRPSSARPQQPDRANAEAQQQQARQQAINHFQYNLLPFLMFDYSRNIIGNIEDGNIDILVEQAQETVDERFAKALVLHAYPEQKTYVLQFEKPEKVGEYFFFAIKKEDSGTFRFYSLEMGITFFGTGNKGVLHEWLSAGDYSDLGGRSYNDLPSFLKELKNGKPEVADDEDSKE